MENLQLQKVRFHDLMASLRPLSTPTDAASRSRGSANSAQFSGKNRDPRTVCEGERNSHIASLAGKWLHRGNTVDELITLALAENASFNPPLDETEVRTTCHNIARTDERNNGLASNRDESGLEPLFFAQDCRASRYFGTAPPPRRWLFTNVIPAGKVCLVVAPGGTGKTMFAIQLGISTATGLPFADAWEAGEKGGVLLLLGEDDDEELHRRTLNIIRQSGPHMDADTLSTLGENLIIKSMVGEDNLLTVADPLSREVRQTALVNRLIRTAQQIPNLKLIVIDPASRFRGGDENASQDVTRFVEAVERVAQATGAAVLIIHHANKGSMNAAEQNQSASRGSSALTDGVRLQMNLVTLDAAGAKKFCILEDQRKSYLTLSITKTNYSAPQPDIILRRGEGGYLTNANLTPMFVQKAGFLDTRIIRIVTEEAAADSRYSKTAFAEKFGGLDGRLQTGIITVRSAVQRLLDNGKLATKSQKLTVPSGRTPKARRSRLPAKPDGRIS